MGGWRNKSGRRKAQRGQAEQGGGHGNNRGGVRISLQERAMRSGRHDESGQGEDGVAVMTAAAMLSRGQRVADDATSETVGRRTM
jgi:hypothetical protein